MAHTETIALVTGVGKETGLGFAVSQALVSLGMTVYVTARKQSQANHIASSLRIEDDGAVVPAALDISDAEAAARLATKVEGEHGKLDILINNAAMTSPYGELAATADLADARAVFDVILFGTWAVCQAMLPLMHRSHAGRLVNVSSGAGSHGDQMFGLTTGNQMGTSYAVSKAALNALTVKLAFEVAETNIKANVVCPGFTATFEGGEAMGARPPAESAKGVIWAATLPEDGPTAGFFRDGVSLSW